MGKEEKRDNKIFGNLGKTRLDFFPRLAIKGFFAISCIAENVMTEGWRKEAQGLTISP